MRDISRAFEDSEQQAAVIEGAAQEVNKLSIRNKSVKGKQNTFQQRTAKLVCYSCGIEGHTKKDPNCPAGGNSVENVNNLTIFRLYIKQRLSKTRKMTEKVTRHG